jgi:hypothetical protein
MTSVVIDLLASYHIAPRGNTQLDNISTYTPQITESGPTSDQLDPMNSFNSPTFRIQGSLPLART